jgi:GTP-binding protein
MEIISAEYIKSSPGHKDCPPANKAEYAFIGRSNVGKSSLINMITRKKDLAKTSATPGKTQLINHFIVNDDQKKHWYLADLPGYGYATVSQKARRNFGNMIESYIRKRENLVCLFVLVDARHEPQSIDLDFINRLGEWEIPFVLVFTKADKLKPLAAQRNVDGFMAKMAATWEVLPPFFITSSKDKSGREELLDYISDLNRNFSP